ncbi:Hypothetical_protein [Hexamita inflata]|uniref:Hypothetical_protein n=1 Tax=Hexamita inflata TaxID=28002 RepID=A0AA86R2W5_9EUKA|nr:Hypothetical protein HINF_LOCUS57080 [Hexamita inflata]
MYDYLVLCCYIQSYATLSALFQYSYHHQWSVFNCKLPLAFQKQMPLLVFPLKDESRQEHFMDLIIDMCQHISKQSRCIQRCQISYPELLKTHFNDNCSHDFQADANPTTNFDRQMTLLRKRRCNYFELLLCFMSCCSVVLVNDKQYILIDLVNGVNVQTNYDHITDKLQVMNIQQELVNVNLTPTLLYQILKDNFENVFLQKMIIQTQTQKNTKIEAFQMSYKPRSRIKQKPKEEFVVVNTQQKEEDGFQVINRDLFPMKETEATNKTEVDISQAVIAQIVHEMDLFV